MQGMQQHTLSTHAQKRHAPLLHCSHWPADQCSQRPETPCHKQSYTHSLVRPLLQARQACLPRCNSHTTASCCHRKQPPPSGKKSLHLFEPTTRQQPAPHPTSKSRQHPTSRADPSSCHVWKGCWLCNVHVALVKPTISMRTTYYAPTPLAMHMQVQRQQSLNSMTSDVHRNHATHQHTDALCLTTQHHAAYKRASSFTQHRGVQHAARPASMCRKHQPTPGMRWRAMQQQTNALSIRRACVQSQSDAQTTRGTLQEHTQL